MVNIYCSAFGLFGVVKNFTTQELKMKFQIRQFRAKGYAGIPQRKYQTRDRKQQNGFFYFEVKFRKYTSHHFLLVKKD